MSDSLCPVVAIGASAGGLEPLIRVLHELPTDTGLTFVVIQHLDPKHKSALPELLSRATSMPVLEVTVGMSVKPDHVYVAAPNFEMELEGRALKLVPRPRTRAVFMPIDRFFRSVAKSRGEKAIGVILSGTGSDGALGLEEIKERGGITFAQDEATAKFPGMPHSAVATGAVDFSLSPEGIVKELKRIVRHPYVAAPAVRKSPEPPPPARDDLSQVLGLVRRAMATDFTHYKTNTIARRIARRMILGKIETVDEYVDFLRRTPGEVEALYHDLLIKVTAFFRDPGTFEALKRVVIEPMLQEHTPGRPIRVWVPGCASGEEAYSIAICFLECLGERASETSLRVFATDVDEAALQKARAGVYLENICVDVSEDRLKRFFTKSGHTFQINRMIRELCTFARHDLCKDPPFSNIDLVSCRNVLIYFEPVLQKRVIPIFHYALNPGGFLTLGPSETIGTYPELFALKDKKAKVYERKPGKSPGPLEFDPRRLAAEDGGRPRPAPGREPAKAADPYQEADQALLHYLAPVGVLLNERFEVMQFRGQTERYLVQAPGRASLDVLKMAREGLLGALKGALDQAAGAGVPVVRKGVRVKSGKTWLTITLKVVPSKPRRTAAQHFMVLFEEAAPAGRRAGPALKGPARGRAIGEENSVLRGELEALRQHLQGTIESQEASNEELRSANEEILSANEELQSTNEELETAKEELQSTNEELTTANDELQRRNVELDTANSDLKNLFVSARLPLVMVGGDLRIRRLTEVAERLFNILPGDVGRPLSDLKLNIHADGIESMVAAVISGGLEKEIDVQDRNGTWYSLQVRPYVGSQDKIEGAVLLFVDLSPVKSGEKLVRALDEARAARDFSEGIVQTVREPLLVLDGEFRVLSANAAYLAAFKTTLEEILRRPFFGLAGGVWDRADLRTALERLVPEEREFHDLEVERDLPAVGRRKLLLNGRQITPSGRGEKLILLALEDVTERRAAERQMRAFSAELEKVVEERTRELTTANRELEAFSHSIAHDLRSPLRSIVSYSQLVVSRAKGLDAEVSGFLQRTVLAGKRMAKLVDDLLELSRLSRKDLKREPVDLSETARSIAEELREQQPERRVELRVEPGLKAEGDPALLGIVMRNLLDNAWKFTQQVPDARVEVGSELKDGERAFFVRDNGAGFDMAYVKKLFGVFQRLHDEEDFPGTGIGLVTVQRIIQRHGGRIWAEGAVNRGAAFFFTLGKD